MEGTCNFGDSCFRVIYVPIVYVFNDDRASTVNEEMVNALGFH